MFDNKLFQVSIQSKLLEEQLSLRTAEKLTGVSISTLSRLTRGETPDMDTFSAIIKWLGVDANTFFPGTPNTAASDMKWMKLYLALGDVDTPLDLQEAIVNLLRRVAKG